MTRARSDRSSGAPATGTLPQSPSWRVPAAAAALALAVAGLVFAGGRVPFNADQSMVGLMASDILDGAHPVFYQGSEYAGTLEPHAVALAFALFGPSQGAQRAVVALEFAAFAALLSAAAGAWFGRRAALAAGLYSTLAPAYLLYKGLTSDGHYGPVLVIGAGVTLLLALLASDAERAARKGPRALLLGLLLGAGLWVSPLCATLLAPTAVVLVGPCRRSLLRPGTLLLLLAGGLAGSLPWWIRNVETGFASLSVPGGSPVDGAGLLERVRSLLFEGVPLLLGPGAIGAGRGPAAVSVVLAAAALVVVVAAGLVGAVSRSEGALARTGLAASGALLLATAALALSVRGQDEPAGIRNFAEPRLLLPGYLAFVPLVGYAASRMWRRPWSVVVLGVAFAAAHGSGWTRMPKWSGLESGDRGAVAAVLAGLDRADVRSVYSPYWGAYQVTFFSGGRIVGSPFGSNASVRREGDRRRVDADPTPGFLLWPPESDRLEEWLRDGRHAFRRSEIGPLSLFSQVEPRALPLLRSGRRVPPVIRPGCVTWRSVGGPARVVSGESATYRVTVRNESLVPWPQGVHLGYHWRRASGGGVEETGRRTLVVGSPGPGEETTLSAAVLADVPPGSYRLTFDLVIEGVAWFEWKGVPPPWRDVEVSALETSAQGSAGPVQAGGPR